MVVQTSADNKTVVNVDLIVAQFCHVYPGEFKHGEIPFNLFWMLWSHFYRILSLNKTVHAESYLIGKNISNGSDKSRTQLRHMTDYSFGQREIL